MIRLSVIIPTHHRAEILAECLRRLEQQTIAQEIEVIIVSDGHDDKSRELFVNNSWRISVKFFEIEKNQQGAARNEGLKYATGEYVLFIGDDIFLEPEACARHLEAYKSFERSALSDEHHHPLIAHSSQLIAILGFTTWDPVVGITDVMTWLEKSGWQFGYPAISVYAHTLLPADIQHKFTYTSHISLPLTEAKKHLFRTDVHLYGWEDIEWGLRLKNSGVRLYYEPSAKALHHHHITLEDSLQRMETLGRSAVEIHKKVPEFDRVPKGWKLLVYRIMSLLPTMAGRHRKAFLDGLECCNNFCN